MLRPDPWFNDSKECDCHVHTFPDEKGGWSSDTYVCRTCLESWLLNVESDMLELREQLTLDLRLTEE